MEVGGSVASQKERIYLEFRSWEVNKLSRLIDRVYPDDGKLISQKITPTMATLNPNVLSILPHLRIFDKPELVYFEKSGPFEKFWVF